MSARALILWLSLMLSLAPAVQAQTAAPSRLRQVMPTAQASGLRGAEGAAQDTAEGADGASAATNILSPTGTASAPSDAGALTTDAQSAAQAAAPITAGGAAASGLSPAFAAPGQAFQADDDCRNACAASYYTCQAGAVSDDCSTGWIQCLEACRNPAPPAGANP